MVSTVVRSTSRPSKADAFSLCSESRLPISSVVVFCEVVVVVAVALSLSLSSRNDFKRSVTPKSNEYSTDPAPPGKNKDNADGDDDDDDVDDTDAFALRNQRAWTLRRANGGWDDAKATAVVDPRPPHSKTAVKPWRSGRQRDKVKRRCLFQNIDTGMVDGRCLCSPVVEVELVRQGKV